jgi:hypothetical protein
MRQSNATASNQLLTETVPKNNETNTEWLKRVGATDGIILLGGNSIAHFRLRVAQSHVRSDLTPSYWSLAGILKGGKTFISVPLDLCGDASDVPLKNGVIRCSIADYDDPSRFPNIAFIRFTNDDDMITEYIEKIEDQRSIIDLPTLMLPWLAYIWSTAESNNPLFEELGLPSAVFVETAYGIAGIELTPGLSSSTSCPEAIWQSAKWWHQFYAAEAGTGGDENAETQVPVGNYGIRQYAAAAVGPKDEIVKKQVVPVTEAVQEAGAPKAARKTQPAAKKARARRS